MCNAWDDYSTPTTRAADMNNHFIIRNVRTGKMIEAHDEHSRDWAESKVQTHNRLYPLDPWKMEPAQA